MPSIMLTGKQREAKTNDQKNKLLECEIAKQMIFFGISSEELRIKMGCSLGTFYNRLKNPSNFSVKELRVLKSELDIDIQYFI